MSKPEYTISPFNGDPALASEVAALHLEVRHRQIEAGENEFRTDISDSQADLRGMQAYYVEPGGNFWIASEVGSGAIAGFVGFRRDSQNEGSLKRLAVMPEHRGHQLGQRLGCALISWVADQDIEYIRLSTGKDELARILIYEPLGFAVVGYDPVHGDHIMEVQLT